VNPGHNDGNPWICKIEKVLANENKLQIVWLYHPTDVPDGLAKNRFRELKELLMSDHSDVIERDTLAGLARVIEKPEIGVVNTLKDWYWTDKYYINLKSVDSLTCKSSRPVTGKKRKRYKYVY
jgi:hypothetical protein